jgi:hypothetical protein
MIYIACLGALVYVHACLGGLGMGLKEVMYNLPGGDPYVCVCVQLEF